jgi:hypothetical protein
VDTGAEDVVSSGTAVNAGEADSSPSALTAPHPDTGGDESDDEYDDGDSGDDDSGGETARLREDAGSSCFHGLPAGPVGPGEPHCGEPQSLFPTSCPPSTSVP